MSFFFNLCSNMGLGSISIFFIFGGNLNMSGVFMILFFSLIMLFGFNFVLNGFGFDNNDNGVSVMLNCSIILIMFMLIFLVLSWMFMSI